jgi:hypothetical protein
VIGYGATAIVAEAVGIVSPQASVVHVLEIMVPMILAIEAFAAGPAAK